MINIKAWMVAGDGPDIRVMECRRIGQNDDDLSTYEDAKTEAIRSLEDYVAPYLARIEELRRDEFQERGKLPECKAWIRKSSWGGSGNLVVARSQQRAAELLHTSTYGIKTRYRLADGDWWYRYGNEESVWIECQDEHRRGTGEYIRALPYEEAEEIAQDELARLKTLPWMQLVSLIEQDEVRERICSHGLPVKVRVKASVSDWEPDTLRVECQIEERTVRGGWGVSSRKIPTNESIAP